MIEGLVRHDTEMRVGKNFVDSHGQSEVAFAFCHLLGSVWLMSRLKRIKYERLYLPDKGIAGDYPNLAGTFVRPSFPASTNGRCDDHSRSGDAYWVLSQLPLCSP